MTTITTPRPAAFVEAIPWTIVATFAAGVAAALWLRARDAAGYRAVGRVATEDAQPTP